MYPLYIFRMASLGLVHPVREREREIPRSIIMVLTMESTLDKRRRHKRDERRQMEGPVSMRYCT